MSQNTLNLFNVPPELLFERIKNQFPQYRYDYRRHVIVLADQQGEAIGQIRLPLHLSIDDQLCILDEHLQALYLSIESGHAAICLMKGKVNVFHTTFSAYMTRKKQGVSQIKYFNKKGKSRAGSRVRLAKTIEFFENINTKLNELFSAYDVARIALNCNATLIPYLRGAKVVCPFDKKDDRLYKIPLHISQSNFTNLDKAIKKLMAPMLFYDTKYEQVINTSGLC